MGENRGLYLLLCKIRKPCQVMLQGCYRKFKKNARYEKTARSSQNVAEENLPFNFICLTFWRALVTPLNAGMSQTQSGLEVDGILFRPEKEDGQQSTTGSWVPCQSSLDLDKWLLLHHRVSGAAATCCIFPLMKAFFVHSPRKKNKVKNLVCLVKEM